MATQLGVQTYSAAQIRREWHFESRFTNPRIPKTELSLLLSLLPQRTAFTIPKEFQKMVKLPGCGVQVHGRPATGTETILCVPSSNCFDSLRPLRFHLLFTL